MGVAYHIHVKLILINFISFKNGLKDSFWFNSSSKFHWIEEKEQGISQVFFANQFDVGLRAISKVNIIVNCCLSQTVEEKPRFIHYGRALRILHHSFSQMVFTVWNSWNFFISRKAEVIFGILCKVNRCGRVDIEKDQRRMRFDGIFYVSASLEL